MYHILRINTNIENLDCLKPPSKWNGGQSQKLGSCCKAYYYKESGYALMQYIFRYFVVGHKI